jgi:predicted MFS family arabinose efflux permease
MISRTFSLYKTSFSGLSPQTWLLSLIMLINRSGTMVIPFMTLYLTGEKMNRTLSEAGIVMGIFGLGSVVGAYFGGKFTDRLGFHKVQTFTLFFGGFMFIILGQIQSYPLICVFTFFLSMVNEAFRPANSSAIAAYSKSENRTRSYSLNRLAINLGWALGTSIGGLLASYNYELLFWVDGFTNIGAGIALLLFLKPAAPQPVDKSSVPTTPPTVQSAYKDKTYIWFTVLTTIFAVGFFQLFTTIPKYFRDHLFMSESFIGFIMAVNGLLIVAVEMVLVYKLEGKKSNLTFVSAGVFVCALSFFALLLPGPAVVVTLIMIVLITIGEVIAMPFMASFWSMRSTESNRGEYAALYTMSWGIAQTIGPLLCSILVDLTSFAVLFIVLGFALIATSLAFLRLNKIDLRQAVRL